MSYLVPGPGTFLLRENLSGRRRERERERGAEDEKDKKTERDRERNVARTNCGSSEMRDMRARSLAWEWTGRGSKNGNECRDGLYKWASYSIRDALGSALTSE